MSETLKRRPWWAAAMVGGGAAGAAIAAAVGLGAPARGEPHVAVATLAETDIAQAKAEQHWRERMETKIDALTEKVAKIEGRLEKR